MSRPLPPASDSDPPKEGISAEENGYVLGLYIAGPSVLSRKAIVNTRKICEEHLPGRYTLEIIDLCQHPSLAALEQIVAAPTLIKKLPLPVRRFVGDMSRTAIILQGLGVESEDLPPPTPWTS